MVEPTLSGNWPRDEDLVRTTRLFDKELATEDELRHSQHVASQHVIALQLQQGANEVTDGQFGWQDLLRPIAESTKGIDVGGLLRFHETNTFLRRPQLVDSFDAADLDVTAFLRYTATDLWKGLPRAKLVLPSPYFFVRTAEAAEGVDAAEAAEPIARVLNAAAQAGADAGARVVQFNDPVLLHEEKPDVDLARRLLGIAVRNLEVETVYYPYAGDAAPHWDALTGFPCHRLGVDFLETELSELGDLPGSKSLLAGIVDSRSSIVEPEDVLRDFLARIATKVDARSLQATHAYDLEFVPSRVAEDKWSALGAACKVAQEVVS